MPDFAIFALGTGLRLDATSNGLAQLSLSALQSLISPKGKQAEKQ